MFDFILRKLSKKHHFKYCSEILSESDEKLTKIAQQVYDLTEQNEGIDKQYLIAYFVHTAGLLRLVREDLNTIFDLWYNPKRSTRPLQPLRAPLAAKFGYPQVGAVKGPYCHSAAFLVAPTAYRRQHLRLGAGRQPRMVNSVNDLKPLRE